MLDCVSGSAENATMIRLVTVVLALASCVSASAQKVLTNNDIVQMMKSGSTDDAILQAIEAQPCNFDISVQALIELKQQGVSKTVINRMLDVARGGGHGDAPATKVSIAPTATDVSAHQVGPSFPVAFSAEQVSYDGPGGTPQLEGKLYVGFGLLRFERTTSGGTEITVVTPRSGTGYVIGPGNDLQTVRNFPGVIGSVGDNGLSKYFLPVNPARPCLNYKGLIACRAIAHEVLNNRSTTKWELTHGIGGESWITYEWIDAKLWIAVRRQYQDHVTELRNIREGEQPASLFQLPASASH